MKVEVFSKRDMPSGSWRSAEIVHGEGKKYFVVYDDDEFIEEVAMNALRPYPSEYTNRWLSGDIGEVFHNNSWRIAQVEGRAERDYYIVRIMGSDQQCKAHKSGLRVRQTWKDNQWTAILEDSRQRHGRTRSHLPGRGKSMCRFPQSCSEENQLDNQNQDLLMEPTRMHSRILKKRPSPPDDCSEAGRKKQAMDEDGRHLRTDAGCSVQLPQKVDAVAYPLKVMGKKHMHSLNNRNSGYSKFHLGTEDTVFDKQYYPMTSSEPSDDESTSSSVGSCSYFNSYRSPHYPLSSPTNDLFSNAAAVESYSSLGRGIFLPTEEMLREETHQIELQAYRSTLLALYASGPLSWEQVLLLTNLRLMLNISNDEHSQELKNLVSSKNR